MGTILLAKDYYFTTQLALRQTQEFNSKKDEMG
jgi:hypothetical protein